MTANVTQVTVVGETTVIGVSGATTAPVISVNVTATPIIQTSTTTIPPISVAVGVQGPTGPQGVQGVGVNSAHISNGDLILTFTNASTVNAGGNIASESYVNNQITNIGLAAVATSGSYTDLTNTPAIPSLSGYATESYVNSQGFLKADDDSTYVTNNSLAITLSDYTTNSALTTTLGSYATQSYVSTQIGNLVNGAPTLLDTLKELSDAIGGDNNFITTINNSIATKLSSVNFNATADTWLATKSTTNLSEGTNLYYTTNRANTDFDNRLLTKSTTNLSEGTNLYFTDIRARAAVSASAISSLTTTGDLTIGGTLTVNGATTYVQSSNTVYTDNLIELHAPTGGVSGTWSSSDGKDVGLRLHYYSNGSDQNAALVLAQDTGYLEWYKFGTETNGVFSGTYGDHKLAGIHFAGDNTTQTTAWNSTASIASSQVTTALGFTPYNATNPTGYITASVLTGYALTSAIPTNNNQLTNGSGYITGITSSNVTTALGFTPYNATNPSGYITSSALTGYALTSSLATVATSGSYSDLSNKPTIPTVGTIAAQNANNVVITGGTIDNTVIGGTTPAAGTVTTFAVAGGLQNLFLQSQTFGVAGSWSATQLTINQTATTAPDSTSTGNSLIPTAVSSIHRVAQGESITAGVTYTASVYAKANGYNYLYFNCGSAFNGSTTFNISTGTVTNIGSGTATITSAGNGWYRCTITGTATATFTASLFIQVNSTQTLATDDTFTGDGTSGIYLWGAQLETSSTVHAYQVTTTAASSSSPKISLSGGGSIGLQSDGSLYVSPAGTGALQAQATTSTATGGNARGANAVDWQTSRNNAAYVASGSTSVIGGGYSNMAQGQYSAVGGGAYNSTSGYNTTIAGGQANQANQRYASIMGGYGNNALGYFNFIGNGYANSGTANAAVTSSTATIAVSAGTTFYLTATNANIKVGQLVNGTGITTFPDTYATSSVTTGTAAVMNTSTISGTTLTVGSLASGTIIAGQVLTGTGVTAGTYIVSGSGSSWTVSTSQTVTSTTITGTAYTFTISQNATTAAGVTLSFYTPHGVVVGGGNNQATGAYSFIGGGGDAGVAANRNVASGDWSFVGGGQQNQATGIASVVVGGGFNSVAYGNSASGISSVVGGGVGNNASGAYSVVCGGYNNTSDSSYSTSFGYRALTRAINNNFVISTRNSYGTFGTSQTGILVISKQTTDATSTVLTSDNNTASTTNQVILPNNSAYTFKGTMIANVTGGGNTSSWEFRGCIKRGAGVGTTALVGTPRIDNIGYDAGASTWAFTLTADTTNGGLAVTVTGAASTTIRWVAKIETTEVTY